MQQNKHQEWESNLCHCASTGSQVQLTTLSTTASDIPIYYCYREREKEPHFAAPGSFEYEFGMRWKQLGEMEKKRQEQVKKEMEEARIKLEDEMQNALYDYQAEQIRQGTHFSSRTYTHTNACKHIHTQTHTPTHTHIQSIESHTNNFSGMETKLTFWDNNLKIISKTFHRSIATSPLDFRANFHVCIHL